jgi:hypothetical protein
VSMPRHLQQKKLKILCYKDISNPYRAMYIGANICLAA